MLHEVVNQQRLPQQDNSATQADNHTKSCSVQTPVLLTGTKPPNPYLQLIK